ncbi:tetratricopeptide repeat protein [Candidatus Amoebophilus asiaticus]|nr:tetratricopeptide repeat protein [Candidatus Amoebophilus asiaticus]
MSNKAIFLYLITSILFLSPARAKGINDNDTTLAFHYFQVADSLKRTAQFDSSSYYYKKAADRFASFNNWDFYVKSHNWIGWNIASHEGRYQKAISYLEKTLETALIKLGEEHLQVMNVNNTIANLYLYSGDYDKSYICHKNNIEHMIKVYGEHHPYIGICYSNIAEVFRLKGDYDKSIEINEIAAKNCAYSFGSDHSMVGGIYNNMGLVFEKRGDYVKALNYFKRSLNIKSKTHSPDHPVIAHCYRNIGQAFFMLHEFDQAMHYCELSLKINLKTLDHGHPEIAENYTTIGNVYYQLQKYSIALKYYQQAMDTYLKTLGDSHSFLAAVYQNMANVYADSIYNHPELNEDRFKRINDKPNLADTTIAISFYLKSLEINERSFGLYHPDVGGIYRNLGILHLSMENHNKCLFYLQKALQALVYDFDDNNINVNPILTGEFQPGRTPSLAGVNNLLTLLEVLVWKAAAFEQKFDLPE